MMHPTISEALAKSRQQQFRREAEQWRLARPARSRAGGVRARPGRPAAAVTGMAAGLASRAFRVTAVLLPAPIRVHGALPGDDAGLSARRLPDAHGRWTRHLRPAAAPARAVRDIGCRCSGAGHDDVPASAAVPAGRGT